MPELIDRPTLGCTEFCADADGLALAGNDPLAYFVDRAQLRGLPQHASVWRGAVFHFASARSQALFTRSPERFAPQYGGWCALGVVLGRKLPGDPSAWRIVDNRLYLTASYERLRAWEIDLARNLRDADVVWSAIRSLSPEVLATLRSHLEAAFTQSRK